MIRIFLIQRIKIYMPNGHVFFQWVHNGK